MTYIQINCSSCNTKFDKRKANYNYRIKENKQTQFYCSKQCRKIGRSQVSEDVVCDTCSKTFQKKMYQIKKTIHSFCSRSCATKHNNKNRLIIDNGKQLYCCNCNSQFIASKFSSKKAKCQLCKTKIIKRARAKTNFTCEICKEPFSWHFKKKTCSMLCFKQISVKSGLASAASQAQKRRSKNEIHFANLCKEIFDTQENQPLFKDKNGNYWDADIILPKLRIAVLWNGIWHYKKIRAKHSVKQVQSRDEIKISIIEDNGYIPYVIKDLGKENAEFVQSEFKIFLQWLNKNGTEATVVNAAG